MFDRMGLFRHSIWESSEDAPVAPPATELVHHDDAIGLEVPAHAEHAQAVGLRGDLPFLGGSTSSPDERALAERNTALAAHTQHVQAVRFGAEPRSRASFLADRSLGLERSEQVEAPGRLHVNGPGRRPDSELELEGEFAV